MDKYDILQQIGDGTFGSVAKAVHKKTGQLVAVKRMKQKYFTWDECVNLPEVQVLRKLHAHPNVIKLREVVRENNELFFVFEFMDGDLLGVIRKAKQQAGAAPPPNAPVVPYSRAKAFMFQLLQSLAHLHKSGYFHRDLKPENLLIRKDPATGQEVVKLADFGLVKEIRCRPPFTDYVSTRWYRAPELLLQDRMYNSPVDIWAAGCIFAEMITTRPLFPGTNEVDQLFKIMSVFGTPTEQVWPEGMALARKIRYTFPNVAPTPLQRVLPPHIPSTALDLMLKMLVYDPKKRITAAQALQHPFFSVGLDEELLTLPPVAAGRPVGGTQSAPNTHVGNQAVQWRQAEVAQRPGSGSRPMFPPVEISKPSPAPSYQQQQQQQQPAPDRDLSKYHLVPVGGTIPASSAAAGSFGATKAPIAALASHHQRSGSGTDDLQPFANRPLTKLEPVAVLPAQPPKVSALPPMTVKPSEASGAASSSRKKQAEIDLDALMDEFASEMATVGVETKRGAVLLPLAPVDGTSPARRDIPPLATGMATQKPPRGTSPIMKTNGSSGQQQQGAELSPLQKLLNSTRYRTSVSNSPAPCGTSKALDQDLQAEAGTTNSSGRFDRKMLVPTSTALSPSVSSILGKKQTINAPIVAQDDNIPSWLKTVPANSGSFGRRPDVLGKAQLVPARSEY
jgi:serine/threonine protein kinase